MSRTITVVVKYMSVVKGKEAYGIIVSDGLYNGYNYSVASPEDLIRHIENGEDVRNAEFAGGKIKFCNGASDRYTKFSMEDGSMLGSAHAVVIDRIENDKGELTGYTMYMANGVVERVKREKAIEIHEKYGISNGKIAPASNGPIISSIAGNYPTYRTEANRKSTVGEKTAGICNVAYVTKAVFGNSEVNYIGLMFNDTNMERLSVNYERAKQANKNLVSYLIDHGMGADVANALLLFRSGVNGFFGGLGTKIAKEIIEDTSGGKINIMGLAGPDVIPVSIIHVNSKGFEEYTTNFKVNGDVMEVGEETNYSEAIKFEMRQLAADFRNWAKALEVEG